MSQTKKETLMDKPLIDLREMLERQDKILTNKKFLEKLKDKGEKVRKFRDEIEKTIKIKESVEEAGSFLAKLSLGNKMILPKHPMFTANNMKSAKQAINEQPQKKDVIKELLNEEIDIFSIALSRTFDAELCQKRSERFIPNKISNKIKANREQSKANGDHKFKKDNLNEKFTDQHSNRQISDNPKQNDVQQDEMEHDRIENDQNSNKSNEASTSKRLNIFEKYKDTALEPYLKDNKFVPLSIESSLEFGKDQKVKDYEIEKIKIENRLEWRKIIEFDSDDTSDTSNSDLDDES